MNDRRRQYRDALAFGAFGVLGLVFFLVVAGITSRPRLRDEYLPGLHRGAGLRVAGYRPLRSRPMVGGPGRGRNRGAADIGAGGGNEVANGADLTSEVNVNKGESK